MPFHQALDQFLFKPSGIERTSLCFYGNGFDPGALAPLYINGVDIHLYPSLSSDFLGGGLSTTAQDLVIFMEMLHGGALIDR